MLVCVVVAVTMVTPYYHPMLVCVVVAVTMVTPCYHSVILLQVLEPYIPLLCNHLSSTATASMVLQSFATMATANADSFTGHLSKLKQTAEQQPTTLASVAKILGAVGRLNQVRPRSLVPWANWTR